MQMPILYKIWVSSDFIILGGPQANPSWRPWTFMVHEFSDSKASLRTWFLLHFLLCHPWSWLRLRKPPLNGHRWLLNTNGVADSLVHVHQEKERHLSPAFQESPFSVYWGLLRHGGSSSTENAMRWLARVTHSPPIELEMGTAPPLPCDCVYKGWEHGCLNRTNLGREEQNFNAV